MAETTFPDGVTDLDELEILVIVDNETDTLSSVDEGVPQIPEVAAISRARSAAGLATMNRVVLLRNFLS